MKLSGNLLLATAICAVTATQALAEPLATLTVRSYGDLQQTITRVAEAVNPKLSINLVQQMNAGLGVTNDAVFDGSRPWQVAVWYEGAASQPFVAVKVPTTDIARFKEALAPQGLLAKQGQDWKQMADGVGLITLRPPGTLPDSAQASLDQWTSAAIPAARHSALLTVSLNESLRQQGLMVLSIVKMSATQAMATNNAFAAGGNPQAMRAIMGAYFDVFETFFKGFQQLQLGVDLGPDVLLVEKVITARPDTELAQWLSKPAGSIPAQDLGLIDPQAMISVAGHVGKNPSLTALMNKFVQLSFQMQNIDTNGPAAKEMTALFERMFPMNLTASVDWRDHLDIAAIYGFPNSSAAAVYAQFKKFFQQGMQGMVGTNKLYSAASLKENAAVIANVPIDRLSITINTNSPLLSMPGQQEQFQSMWPAGKIEFDYAVKNDRLLLASPERMKQLLTTEPKAANQSWAATIKPTTVAAGYVNLINLIQRSVTANPMLPATIKEKLSHLEAQGTSVAFQVNLDNQLQASAQIPFKLLRQFGRLNETP